MTWPAGLQSLTFGARFQSEPGQCDMASRPSKFDFWIGSFNQSLDNVTWPAGLQSLTFGLIFDQSLDNVTWPAGLQRLLTFGGKLQWSLDNVTWPAGLQSLTFGRKFQSEPGQCDMASRPSKFDFW